MCAHGREIGRGAENAVHRPTDNESVAAAYDVLWYNLSVLSGRCKPIPIDRKRCKAIVKRNLGTFGGDDPGAEVCAHVRAPLSVFHHGHPKASLEIGERPFLFSDGCDDGGARLQGFRGLTYEQGRTGKCCAGSGVG